MYKHWHSNLSQHLVLKLLKAECCRSGRHHWFVMNKDSSKNQRTQRSSLAVRGWATTVAADRSMELFSQHWHFSSVLCEEWPVGVGLNFDTSKSTQRCLIYALPMTRVFRTLNFVFLVKKVMRPMAYLAEWEAELKAMPQSCESCGPCACQYTMCLVGQHPFRSWALAFQIAFGALQRGVWSSDIKLNVNLECTMQRFSDVFR